MIALALIGCGAPCGGPGTACQIAGTGVAGFGAPGERALETDLYWPADVAVAPNGTPWVVDWNNHRLVTIDGDGRDATVEAVTGGGFPGDPLGQDLASARWNHPTGIAFGPDGSVVVAAWHNSRVMSFQPDGGAVAHLAGDGTRAFGGDGGPATEAMLDLPSSVAFGPDGRLYVTDQANQRVRCIDGDGAISTVAGDGERRWSGPEGDALEVSLQLEVSQNADPAGRIAFDGSGYYIADTLNHVVRYVDLDAGTMSTVMGRRELGDVGVGPDEVGLYFPRDVAVGPDGALYVADTQNACVRKLDDGEVSTVVGVCEEPGADGGDGAIADVRLDQPLGVDVTADGRVWVADTWNHRILVVTPE